jgi:hypothetical protein
VSSSASSPSSSSLPHLPAIERKRRRRPSSSAVGQDENTVQAMKNEERRKRAKTTPAYETSLATNTKTGNKGPQRTQARTNNQAAGTNTTTTSTTVWIKMETSFLVASPPRSSRRQPKEATKQSQPRSRSHRNAPGASRRRNANPTATAHSPRQAPLAPLQPRERAYRFHNVSVCQSGSPTLRMEDRVC